MVFDFTDKVVLLTGAGVGIGAAAAEAYAENGAKVAVNSVSDSGQRLVEKIGAFGGQALFVQGDVSDPGQVQEMIRHTVEQFGGLDIVVNCAGIVSGGTVEEVELEQWEHVMAVNVTGTYLVCKYAMPHLKKSKGVIVNISSLVAVKGIANRAVYSASKGAVLALSKAMAADHLKDGVRVNVVSPGTVLSPSLMQRIQSEPDPDAAMKNYVSRQPLGRLGTPEEIAAAILFSSSEEAGFLDGANIQIDGAGSL